MEGGKIKVRVNGEPLTLHQGMRVKHALMAFDQEIYEAVLEGRIRLVDADGFQVGLEGALSDGTSFTTEAVA